MTGSFLLRETGDLLLQEDGYYIILDIPENTSNPDYGDVFYDEGDIAIVGPHGDELFTNDPAADGSGGFSAVVTDYITMGVLNGSFPLGPALGLSTAIGSNNPMPYWSGPHVVSGNSITVTQELDSTGADRNLRFTMAAGAAGDEVFMEQLVRIPHSRSFTVNPTALWYCPTSLKGTAGSAQMYLAAQFLQADAVTAAGTETSTPALILDTVDAQVGDVLEWDVLPNTTGAVPAAASFVRLRLGMKRGAAGTSAAGSVDVTDIRVITTDDYISLGDINNTFAPARVFQLDGAIYIWPASVVSSYVLSSTLLEVPGAIEAREIAAPSTPGIGTYRTYAKTDHIFYGKGSDGKERRFGHYSGTGSPESAVTAPVGSLYLRTDGGAGTTLYVKESGAGNTGWVGK